MVCRDDVLIGLCESRYRRHAECHWIAAPNWASTVELRSASWFAMSVKRGDHERMNEEGLDQAAAGPRVVWIPTVTLSGNRDSVDLYDIAAFTNEKEAELAAERWRNEGRPDADIAMNVVALYDTADEWAEDR